MNKFWKMAGITIGLVALIVVMGATAAFAQGPQGGFGMHRHGQQGSGMHLMAVDQATMHAAIADALGISVEEFEAALAEGKTPAILAQELGVDFADVLAAMDAVHADALQQAVDDGLITQEQADWMLSHRGGQQRGNGGAGNGFGGGMGQGFGGHNGNCPYQTP